MSGGSLLMAGSRAMDVGTHLFREVILCAMAGCVAILVCMLLADDIGRLFQ
jgi:hypothetical protein